MKIQYNLIFESKKQQQKYSKFKNLNVLTIFMVLLQYMISPNYSPLHLGITYFSVPIQGCFGKFVLFYLIAFWFN
jgi:hypothetical protein